MNYKKNVLYALAILAFLAAFIIGVVPSKTDAVEIVTPAPQPTYHQQVWMDALEWCESQGSTTVKVVDSDGYYSYGALQFHMATFMNFAKMYGIQVTPDDIYNVDTQKEVAYQMLTHGLQSQWTCAAKIGGRFPKN